MTAGFGQKTDESKASTDGQGGGGAGRDTPSWQPIDLRGVIAGECRPAVPTLLERTDGQCLLYPGLTHSLHGEPESAKSLLMQAEAAVRINRGEEVLYLDFESDKESVVARLLEFGAHPQAILDHFHYVRPEVAPDSSPQEQAAWQAVLSVRYTLAVIDSVTEALAVLALVIDQQRRPGRVEPDGAAQDRRATGAAVVLIDHVVKDITTRNRWAIGGQTKMAGLTGASYSLEVHQALGRGMRGELRLRVGKDRPGSVRPHCGPFRKSDRTQEAARIVIDSTDGPTVITVWPPGNEGDAGQDDDFRPTNLMERVSRHVEAHPGECTKDGLTKEVTGKKTSLRLAVDILTDEGFLIVGPGKRSGSRVYTSVRQYREADDPLSDSYSDFAERSAPEHDERASGRWCGVTDFSPPKPFPGRPRSVGPEKAVPVPVPLCRGGERGTTLRTRSRGTTGNDFGNGERFHAPAHIHTRHRRTAWPARFRPARGRP